eukprot:g11302.t1
MPPRRRTPASQDDGSGGDLSNTLRGGASAAGGRARAGGGITLSGASGSLVLGDGIPVPEYGTFSRAESARFYREYDEYKRKQVLGNSGQSVQRQLLTVAQLLPRHIRVSLRQRIFPTERGELSEAQLLEALARHGQCWTGDSRKWLRVLTASRAGKPGSASGGAAQGAARPQGHRQSTKKAPPAKGTPAARGGSQQPPAAHGAAVAGRSAVPDSASAPAAGATSSVVPPAPLPVAGGALSGDAPAPVSVTSSWRSVAAEGASALLSDEVAVEPCEQSCLVDLSIPGVAHPTVCPVKAVLDSGAGISTLSTCHVRKLQDAFPDVRVVEPMGQGHMLRVIDGREVRVTEKTCPVRVALHTRWGPVVVSPQRFAVVPGTDDVMIIGSPMIKLLGIDAYETAAARARAGHDARVTGVETPGVAEAPRVALSVAALQQVDATEVPDEAVARLVARGPNMVMSPAEEEQGRVAALDAAIDRAADAGLSDAGVSRLRSMLAQHGGRHSDAFRRALRGDPPADVPPMEVRQGSTDAEGREDVSSQGGGGEEDLMSEFNLDVTEVQGPEMLPERTTAPAAPGNGVLGSRTPPSPLSVGGDSGRGDDFPRPTSGGGSSSGSSHGRDTPSPLSVGGDFGGGGDDYSPSHTSDSRSDRQNTEGQEEEVTRRHTPGNPVNHQKQPPEKMRCLEAFIVALSQACGGKDSYWYASTFDLHLTSLEFCRACRSVRHWT